jgi:putative addiction module component (TIGR02574 family)
VTDVEILKMPIADDVRNELDRRLENYYRNPETARPWEDIREELLRMKCGD